MYKPRKATTDIDQNPLIDPIIDQVDQMIADSENHLFCSNCRDRKVNGSRTDTDCHSQVSLSHCCLPLKTMLILSLELEPADIGQVVQTYMAIG